MKKRLISSVLVLAALASITLLNSRALAAGSISNSLTGFTGASPDAPTQAAVDTAGFEFSSNNGLAADFSSDPSIVFNNSGATFGSLFAGDGGRNYMRTKDSYAFTSYTAEVTVTVDTLATDVVFFGMGSGNIALWGTPDFAGVPTVFVTPENTAVNTNAVDGINGDWYGPSPPCPAGDWCKTDAPGLLGTAAGTHRLRMTFDAAAKTWVASVDIDYAGGPFVADVTTPTYDLSLSFNDGGFVTNGWDPDPLISKPSKIYFGGDDGATFKDFSVTVPAPGVAGDYNGNGVVDAADYVLWRNGGPLANEVDTPGTVNAADYDAWRTRFGNTAGSGSGLAAAGVPEPSSIILVLSALLAPVAVRRSRAS